MRFIMVVAKYAREYNKHRIVYTLPGFVFYTVYEFISTYGRHEVKFVRLHHKWDILLPYSL